MKDNHPDFMRLSAKAQKKPQQLALPNRFPLDDYKWDALVQIVEESESHTTKEHIDGKEHVSKTKKKITTLKYDKKILERSQVLWNDFRDQSKMRSLHALNDGCDVQNVVKQLLYDVNGQKNRPRYHAICKTDKDGSLATYNRQLESDHCQWIRHDPNEALTVVNEHGKKLLMFALQAGIYLLKMSFWVRKRQVALYAYDAQPDGTTYVIVVYFDKASNGLRCLRDNRFKLAEFCECDADCLEEEIGHLENAVESRKQELLTALERFVLSKHDIIQYLDYSQSSCMESVKADEAAGIEIVD